MKRNMIIVYHTFLVFLSAFLGVLIIYGFTSQAELNALAKNCEKEIHDAFGAVQRVAPTETQQYTSLVRNQQSYLERRDSHRRWVTINVVFFAVALFQLYGRLTSIMKDKNVT